MSRPAAFNYASLAPIMLTPSVIIFGLDGSGTRLLRWLQRSFGVVGIVGAFLFFSTVLPVHENWGCYKSQDIHDVNYGRCTQRDAVIRRMPELQSPQKDFYLWTKTATIFIASLIVILVINVLILATRMIIIRIDLARLSIPRLEDIPEDQRTESVKRLLEEAHEHAKGHWFFRPRADHSLVHFAHRVRLIYLIDPCSFVLCLSSIPLRLRHGGLHIVAQFILCFNFAFSLMVYLMTSHVRWKWWFMVCFGCVCLAIAFVHHIIMYMRFLHAIHTNIPVVNSAIVKKSAEASNNSFIHLHNVVSESMANLAI